MHGECLCGTVQFEFDDTSSKLYHCHCSLCRKQSGSSSNAALVIPTDSLHWLGGREHVSSYVKPTGFRSDFCSTCGSPVPNPIGASQYSWVPAGLLNPNYQFKIGAHVFVGSRAPWDTIFSPGPQYETMPEFSEFIAVLHSNADT